MTVILKVASATMMTRVGLQAGGLLGGCGPTTSIKQKPVRIRKSQVRTAVPGGSKGRERDQRA